MQPQDTGGGGQRSLCHFSCCALSHVTMRMVGTAVDTWQVLHRCMFHECVTVDPGTSMAPAPFAWDDASGAWASLVCGSSVGESPVALDSACLTACSLYPKIGLT